MGLSGGIVEGMSEEGHIRLHVLEMATDEGADMPCPDTRIRSPWDIMVRASAVSSEGSSNSPTTNKVGADTRVSVSHSSQSNSGRTRHQLMNCSTG